MHAVNKTQKASGDSVPQRKSLMLLIQSRSPGTSVPDTGMMLHDPWASDTESDSSQHSDIFSEPSQHSDTDSERHSTTSRASTPPPEAPDDYELCIWCNDKATRAISQIDDGLAKLQLEEERRKKEGRYAHWRDDVERRLCAAYDAVHTGVSTTAVPSWWGRHARKDLPPGTIIDAPSHAPENGTEVAVLDVNRSATVCGIVYTKRRLMVVVKNHAMNSVCVPVYSDGGRGLAGKSADAREEFVAVRNVWSSWAPGNGHQALLAASQCGQVFKDKSYAKFTELRSHYHGTMCGLAGRLDDASTRRLLNLVRGALV